MVAERFVVFIFADAQPFAGREHHIIAAVTGNTAGVDQIGFMDAQELTVFLAKQRLHHIEFLVKRVAAVCGNDVGASSLRGKISDFINGDVEVLWPDIIGEGVRIVKKCFIGECSAGPQMFSGLVWHDIQWF